MARAAVSSCPIVNPDVQPTKDTSARSSHLRRSFTLLPQPLFATLLPPRAAPIEPWSRLPLFLSMSAFPGANIACLTYMCSIQTFPRM
jgi:hypothetical protein